MLNVFKDYDQISLDSQYNNRALVPDYQDYFDQWKTWNDALIADPHIIRNIKYGDLSRQRMDIQPSKQVKSPVVVFIHGGYWQRMDRSDFTYIFNVFKERNITTVVLGYPICPEVDMQTIVLSVKQGLEWIGQNISLYNGNPTNVKIIGHSAGGHLAAILSTVHYRPIGIHITRVLSLSGLFDLLPIQHSFVNGPLKMNVHTAFALSPINLLPSSDADMIIAVGGDESDEYHSQSRTLVETWKPHLKNINLEIIPRANHFSIVSDFNVLTSIL